jgi:hypothetical protein
MSETHKPLPVEGYTEQAKATIAEVNANKQLEELVLRRVEWIQQQAQIPYDPRWAALAKTHIQEGFMALNRAIFQPQRIEDLNLETLADLATKLDAHN